MSVKTKILIFLFITTSLLTAQQLSPEVKSLRTALKSNNPPVILDVRTFEEYSKNRIPTAINVPINDLSRDLMQDLVPIKSKAIYVYCKKGIKSRQAIELLEQYAYTNLFDIQSIDNWLYGTVSSEGWVIGPSNADIEIIEYIDLACPYCAQAAKAHYELFQKHGHQVRFVFRHFPLNKHEHARLAHAALIAAGRQGHFWDYRFSIPKYFYDLNKANLLTIATFLELDIVRFKNDINSIIDDTIEIDRDISAGKNIGVTSTPTYFVNGSQVSNPAIAVETLLAGENIEQTDITTSAGCTEETHNED